MERYLEFVHISRGTITGTTINDISTNDRLLTFPIVTSGFFEYDGWYNYYLYTDSSKSELLDLGKCHLKVNDDKKILNRPETNNTILKRY